MSYLKKAIKLQKLVYEKQIPLKIKYFCHQLQRIFTVFQLFSKLSNNN